MKNVYRFEKRVNCVERHMQQIPDRLCALRDDCILAISIENKDTIIARLKKQLERIERLLDKVTADRI